MINDDSYPCSQVANKGYSGKLSMMTNQGGNHPAILVAIFVFILILVITRDPMLLIQPRFWAEDGAHFYEFAFSHDWLDTLLFHPNYRLLLSNLSALAATGIVDMELAPLPFTLKSLLIMSAAVAIVIWGNSELWNTPLKKLLVSLIIVFAPVSDETWLNANGTQYYSALITALLLCESMPQSGWIRKLLYRVLLLTGSLNGLLSCVLTPLYWIKAFRSRDREVFIQAIILSIGCLIQLLSMSIETDSAERHRLTSLATFGWITAIKTYGHVFSREFGQLLYDIIITDGQVPYMVSRLYFLLGYMWLAIWLGILAALAYRLRQSVALYLLASYVLLFVFVSIFAIAGRDNIFLLYPLLGNRYFFIPSALLLIVIMTSIQVPGRNVRSSAWAITASIVLTLGLLNSIHKYYTALDDFSAYPEWKIEVGKWQSNPQHRLSIWPPPWAIDLDQPR
jgi:hypothetical protein